MAGKYEDWCNGNNLGAYPPTYQSVAGYMVNWILGKLGSTKSIGNLKSAIRMTAVEKGVGWMAESDHLKLNRLIAKMRYEDLKPVNRKKAAQLRMLKRWVERMDLSDLRQLQEAVLLFTGHDGLFRIGELLCGLTTEDVNWSNDREKVTFWLDRSKCNVSGDGEAISLLDYEGISGVKLLRLWYDVNNLWDESDRVLFPARDRNKRWDWARTTSTSWLRAVIKKHARADGLNDKEFSGHSLRAGGATDLFVMRVPYFLIKKMGRWRSDAAMLYYRSEEDVCLAVARAFGELSRS